MNASNSPCPIVTFVVSLGISTNITLPITVITLAIHFFLYINVVSAPLATLNDSL